MSKNRVWNLASLRDVLSPGHRIHDLRSRGRRSDLLKLPTLGSDFGSIISLKLFEKKITLQFLIYTWNDFNALVWEQEANPVANKNEYITEGHTYTFRKTLKGLKYKKQKE